jgi:hypothetical protein
MDMADQRIAHVSFLDDDAELEAIVDDILVFQEEVQDIAPTGMQRAPSQTLVLVDAATPPDGNEPPAPGIYFVFSNDEGALQADAVTVYGWDYVRKEPVETPADRDASGDPAVTFTDDISAIEQLLLDSQDFQDAVPDAAADAGIDDLAVYIVEDQDSVASVRQSATVIMFDQSSDAYILQNNQTDFDFLV